MNSLSVTQLWSLFHVCVHRLEPKIHEPMQVGELYSSCHGNQVHAGRQSLAFHLNARPCAVLNFHDVLEEAGHFVSERWVYSCLLLAVLATV